MLLNYLSFLFTTPFIQRVLQEQGVYPQPKERSEDYYKDAFYALAMGDIQQASDLLINTDSKLSSTLYTLGIERIKKVSLK